MRIAGKYLKLTVIQGASTPLLLRIQTKGGFVQYSTTNNFAKKTGVPKLGLEYDKNMTMGLVGSLAEAAHN